MKFFVIFWVIPLVTAFLLLGLFLKLGFVFSFWLAGLFLQLLLCRIAKRMSSGIFESLAVYLLAGLMIFWRESFAVFFILGTIVRNKAFLLTGGDACATL